MKKNFFREDIAVKEDKFNVLKNLYEVLPINKKRVDVEIIKTSIRLVAANLNFYKEDSILIEHFSNRYIVSPHRSFKTERKVIELLNALVYIDIYKALSNVEFKKLKDSGHDMSEHMENGKHRLSSMWLTEKGKAFFAGVSASLELVTRRTKVKAVKGESQSRKGYKYFPFQADELEELKRYENFLTKLNELTNKHILEYVDAETGELVEFNNDCRIIFSGNESNKIYDHRRRGGRYVSEVSYMWKQNRLNITIDGKRTVEIDYKCSLPSIMFGKFKVDLSVLEHDLYYVPNEQNCDLMRKLAKTIVVCMLGVTSEYTLELALSNKFYKYQNGLKEDGHPVERFFPANFEFEDIKRVIGKILQKYRSMCPSVDKILFQKDLTTNILQGIEARIATKILNKFVQIGKPILCIHDSFRALEDDEDLLKKLMNEYYIAEVGMKPLGLKADRQPQHSQLRVDEVELNRNEPDSILFKPKDAIYTDASGDEYGDAGWIQDIDGIEYEYNGLRYRFNPDLNQDYLLDDSGFGLGWIPQASRNAYDLHLTNA